MHAEPEEPLRHDAGPVLFIADLHLDPARPAMIERFERFCRETVTNARALYVLGDLFEVWIGDDDDDPAHARVLDALAGATAAGVPGWFLPGNRDFLVGDGFFARSGLRPLGDEQRIELFGVPTLLCHGDTLCTDDVDYQRFRARVRDPDWQREFLARPLRERRELAAGLRSDSGDAMAAKEATALDVNANAVAAAVVRTGVDRLIHGHTHKPGRHDHEIDGRMVERWVLGDWYERASVLVATPGGIELQEP
ncbi:MAG: UDP-2,3-diacylglucosamine diphosphatase [Halofilum sp. (in: g-proteobacteria)]|nr:UDP-2,3-diacylglucosamine diphosphatase [Halofilum sp. (in: g-proteobacteria)]